MIQVCHLFAHRYILSTWDCVLATRILATRILAPAEIECTAVARAHFGRRSPSWTLLHGNIWPDVAIQQRGLPFPGLLSMGYQGGAFSDALRIYFVPLQLLLILRKHDGHEALGCCIGTPVAEVHRRMPQNFLYIILASHETTAQRPG
jgi:hypothetical protein